MSQTAFIFPGQGSQTVGMLSAAHECYDVVRSTFVEASDALGFDLWEMASAGPSETLALTANTQPLILTASVALYRAWLSLGGVAPTLAAGHSLGEFSALVAAGSLEFAQAVTLVRTRGEAMQEAVPVGVGAMAAVIGLDDETINGICKEHNRDPGHQVLAVNFNSPGQVVIAGHAQAVAEAADGLKAAGAKRVLPLPVSAPFHTPLMSHAGEVLQRELEAITVRDPSMPVISNVDAAAQTDGAVIKRLLVQQVSAPVQWTGCMNTMIAAGATRFVECGPGKVLSGLVRRIDKTVSCSNIESPEDFDANLSNS